MGPTTIGANCERPEILAELAALDVSVTVADGKLRFAPASAVPPDLLAELRSQKTAVLELLADPIEAAVAWRAAAMRKLVPQRGPIPTLVAKRAPPGRNTCVSCGEPVFAAARLPRCQPCGLAAIRVLNELIATKEHHG